MLTVDKLEGKTFITCDSCEKNFNVHMNIMGDGKLSWMNAVDLLKEKHWKMVVNEGGNIWMVYCNQCRSL